MLGANAVEPIIEKPSQVTEVHGAVVIKVCAVAAIWLGAISAAPVFGQEWKVVKVYIAITIEVYGV